jgi:intracellular septation protein A
VSAARAIFPSGRREGNVGLNSPHAGVPGEPAAAPSLRTVVVRTAASIAVACVGPALLFAAVLVGSNVYLAIVAVLAWSCGVMVWRSSTRRPVSGVLVLTLAILAVRSAFTLATGNTFVYFVQPVLVDAAVAGAFLASLLSARPLVERMAPEFYPMTDALASRPRVRALFRRLTLMWGLVVVAKGAITLWLLQTLSTVDFVLIKNGAVMALTVTAAAVTIWLSARVVGEERILARA